MKRFSNAHTLVELLVGLLIASLIMMSIAVLTSISSRGHRRVMTESNIFSDLAYGLKLMQNRVRVGKKIAKDSPGGQWIGSRLMVVQPELMEVFGIFQEGVHADKEFVHVPDVINHPDVKETLFSVPAADSIGLTLNVGTRFVTITVAGTKNNIPFSLTSKILKRML